MFSFCINVLKHLNKILPNDYLAFSITPFFHGLLLILLNSNLMAFLPSGHVKPVISLFYLSLN